MNIHLQYQLFWCEQKGDRVLMHPHISISKFYEKTAWKPVKKNTIILASNFDTAAESQAHWSAKPEAS